MTSGYWLQTHSVGADDGNLVTSSIGRSLDVGTETSAYDVQTTSGLHLRKSTIFRRRNYSIGNSTFIRRRFAVGRLIKPMADTTHKLCIRGTHKITKNSFAHVQNFHRTYFSSPVCSLLHKRLHTSFTHHFITRFGTNNSRFS